jgi:hypothetical protein
MDEKTAKALDEMRRAVAKSQGVKESEVEMTVHYRTEEVPDYFYNIEETECECGHQRDCHFNAGERNICCGGESVNDENDCLCKGFKEKSDAD